MEWKYFNPISGGVWRGAYSGWGGGKIAPPCLKSLIIGMVRKNLSRLQNNTKSLRWRQNVSDDVIFFDDVSTFCGGRWHFFSIFCEKYLFHRNDHKIWNIHPPEMVDPSFWYQYIGLCYKSARNKFQWASWGEKCLLTSAFFVVWVLFVYDVI